MSYDLYLKPRIGAFTRDDFARYFATRPHYRLAGEQAWYQNDSTGVYFTFTIQLDHARYPVAFNMNYFRPSYFACEAEPEVRRFIETFNMQVDDPQVEGMGQGDYDPRGFISGWTYGNAFGCQAILDQNPQIAIDTLPASVLKAVWTWNFRKDALQESLQMDIFVPRILLLKYRKRAVTAAVWPEAIPSLLPPVDILVIGRQTLAPHEFFRPGEDLVVGEWKTFQPLLESHKSGMLHGGYCLSYSSVPEDIRRAVQALPAAEGELAGLANDRVLDRELVYKLLH